MPPFLPIHAFPSLFIFTSLIWIIKTDFKQSSSWLSLSKRSRRVGFGRQTFPSHFSSFHEGSRQQVHQNFLESRNLLRIFININFFYLWHWSRHLSTTTKNKNHEKLHWTVTLNKMFLFWIAFFCNPPALPLPLSIIQTGWWRRGLETTTTLTPVAPSFDAKNISNCYQNVCYQNYSVKEKATICRRWI